MLRERAPKFEFLEAESEGELQTIRIDSGPASGVKYRYGVISFSGIDENGDLIDGGEPSINFTYELAEDCDVEVDQVIIDEMGKILSVLLDAKYGGEDNEESIDGENDPEQSGSG